MEKAYDLKELGKRLKEKGLIQAEQDAEVFYKEVSAFLKESAQLSTTPFDDLAIPMLAKFDEKVLAKIDKIDGVVGN